MKINITQISLKEHLSVSPRIYLVVIGLFYVTTYGITIALILSHEIAPAIELARRIGDGSCKIMATSDSVKSYKRDQLLKKNRCVRCGCCCLISCNLWMYVLAMDAVYYLDRIYTAGLICVCV